MIWTPHVTVAAVVEQARRFLLVERRRRARVFNQPAGRRYPLELLVDVI
ncbi:hypothetical protein [Thermithiobacillus plumbiphilus]|uniref:Transposase n=1 Tax=Thermithiobacillus plumbiphilus TaxID=1729899 RepID=A0ABU9DB17_9PROT